MTTHRMQYEIVSDAPIEVVRVAMGAADRHSLEVRIHSGVMRVWVYPIAELPVDEQDPDAERRFRRWLREYLPGAVAVPLCTWMAEGEA